MQYKVLKRSQRLDEIPIDLHGKQRSGPTKVFFYAYLLSCIEEMPPHAKPFDP